MTNGYNYDALNNILTISASFAKKASKVNTEEYRIILKLRRDFPNLVIKQEEKKEGKKRMNYGQMESFISMHRNAEELKSQFERVKKLSQFQSMPYQYVKSWFDAEFPYYENPEMDKDGYIVDPVTLNSAKNMLQEVTDGNSTETVEAEPVEAAA